MPLPLPLSSPILRKLLMLSKSLIRQGRLPRGLLKQIVRIVMTVRFLRRGNWYLRFPARLRLCRSLPVSVRFPAQLRLCQSLPGSVWILSGSCRWSLRLPRAARKWFPCSRRSAEASGPAEAPESAGPRRETAEKAPCLYSACGGLYSH